MGDANSFGQGSRVRFGPYEVDFGSGELSKHGIRIKLQDQPLRILKSLLEHPGQVIPREELIRVLWPEGTFVDYDHGLNAGIAKLRQALLDSADKPHYIETIGRRGYRFIAKIEANVTSTPPSSPRRWLVWALVSAGLILVVAASLFYLRRTVTTPPLVKVAPLTSFPGRQFTPAISPDGKQVAFSWNGENSGNFDIYVKLLDASAPLKLTSSPADEYFPAWSPDNRAIAFCRSVSGHVELWMVPALGGAERKVGESAECEGLSWSPNGKSLALVDRELPRGPYHLALLTVETGEKRKISSPPDESFGDFSPVFSPDGRAIAFRRASSSVTEDLYVLPLTIAGETQGKPRRLTSQERVFGLDWMADGRRIVYSSDRYGRTGIWTILVSGGVPEQLVVGGENAEGISVSRNGHNRLVYVRETVDANIWRMPGPASSDRNEVSTRLIASTKLDQEPQLSPDGNKIVFSSDRSGTAELWVSDGEGHNPAQLTSLGGPIPGSPRWSPDSQRVTFDCSKAGNSDIYTINVDGGPPHRVTTESSIDVRPSWSRDGRWIYFGSNRTGEWQIWRSSTQSQQVLQVTKSSGAREAFESFDGKFLYYAKLDLPGIWKIPVEGGEETRVIEQGEMGLWALTQQGICFFDLKAGPTLKFYSPALKFYSFGAHQTSLLRRFSRDIVIDMDNNAISVSTDGRWILYTQLDQLGSNLMLVENFR
jgi:Tol biopolymer transport system component/DNA-binding winged helix-turn-helix (wHTH) protein